MDLVYLQWDMPITADAIVANYEFQVNGGGWTNVAKPQKASDGVVNTYEYPIGVRGVSMPDGSYTANVRACNVSGCTPGATLAFSVGSPTMPPPPPPPAPAAPMNLRVSGN